MKEELLLRETLMMNGYPEKFIEVHSKRKIRDEKVPNAPKKDVYLRLPFKGDHILNHISHKVKSALNRVYPAAQLTMLSSCRGINLDTKKGNLPTTSISYVIYRFTCSCGDTYIGRTNRQLSQRISEHIPKWLLNSLTLKNPDNSTKTINPASPIAKHLWDSGHVVDPKSAFSILLRNRNAKLLSLSEALLIKIHHPRLCIQKILTHNVCLPWT